MNHAEPDMVNHPPHYTQGEIECIDAIEASMDPVEFAGFLKGTVMRYMWRFEKKWNPEEDVEKALFYLERLVSHMKKHPDLFRDCENIYTVTVGEIQDAPEKTAKSLIDKLKTPNLHI